MTLTYCGHKTTMAITQGWRRSEPVCGVPGRQLRTAVVLCSEGQYVCLQAEMPVHASWPVYAS